MHLSLLSQSGETHTRERHRTCTRWNLFAWLYRLALKKQGGGFTRVLLRGKSSNWAIRGQSWKIRDFFLGNFRGKSHCRCFSRGKIDESGTKAPLLPPLSFSNPRYIAVPFFSFFFQFFCPLSSPSSSLDLS